MSIVYHIYSGNSSGGPIDYTTIVATAGSLSAALAALPLGSTTRLAVRAYDTVSGLEEQNVDAVLTITVGSTGADLTGVPRPPIALSARAAAAGAVRLDWSYPYPGSKNLPVGFHVYRGPTGAVSYASPVATVLYGGVPNLHTTVTGQTDAVSYDFVVRSYNAAGEEGNTVAVTVVADATAPLNVQSLTATLVP